MAQTFHGQLKDRIGKVVLVKFDQREGLVGKLASVLDDYIVLETDDAALSTVFIPLDQIRYFYEPKEK